MQVPVVLPEGDIFDHDVDPARPLRCACSPHIERTVDGQLADVPAEVVVVHSLLARAPIRVA